jgi:hypothetical protein
LDETGDDYENQHRYAMRKDDDRSRFETPADGSLVFD